MCLCWGLAVLAESCLSLSVTWYLVESINLPWQSPQKTPKPQVPLELWLQRLRNEKEAPPCSAPDGGPGLPH